MSATYEWIYDFCKSGNGQLTVGSFLPIINAAGKKTQWGQPYKSPHGLGSAISAAWRYVDRNYGRSEADHIASTFIDPITGELVWKKYHQ